MMVHSETLFDLNLGSLEEHIESMYSEIVEDKVKASKQILAMCFNPQNISEMVYHDRLFGLLSRTLRDDFKKSQDLTMFIGTFSQYHGLLLQNQIGDTSLKIIDYQLKKYQVRLREMQTKEVDEKEKRKWGLMVKKQNKMFYIFFSILLNLAEDISIEKKIRRRSIIPFLIQTLERNHMDLLLVLMTFLKKLSVFSENKDEMLEQGLAEQLLRFVPCPHALIYNLSFDPKWREKFDTCGYVPRLVSLLRESAFRALILKVLYQLSLNDRTKSTFTYTECLPIVYQMILNFPEQRVGEELIALAINLATNPRNAEIMSEGDQLEKLFQRAIKYRDSLLMKLIRNISFSAKISHVQDTIYSFGQDLINLMVKPHEEADFLVESLGTLVNLEQTAWDELLTSTKILEFLHKSLSVGYADDDIVLESIMLVGTLVSNSKSAQMIANSMIIKQLHTLLSEKQEDDEMVQQILFTFYKMVFYKETREIILHQTQVVNYMLELLQDKNPRIRRMADTVLSVVQEVDPNWSQQIRHKRFQLYNQEWIQAVQNLEQWAMESDSEGEDMEDEDQFQNWMWGYEQEEEEEDDDYD